MRRSSDAESLHSILRRIAQRPELQEKLATQTIFHHWQAIVGPTIARHSRPRVVRQKTLIVLVDNHSWAQELTYREAEILENLRSACPESGVNAIRFQVGPLRSASSTSSTSVTPARTTRPKLSSIRLDPEQEKVLRSIESEIKSPELARKVVSVARQNMQLQRWRKKRGFRTCPRCERLYRGRERLCPVCRAER